MQQAFAIATTDQFSATRRTNKKTTPPAYQVCGTNRNDETKALCHCTKDAELVAAEMVKTYQNVTVWQWVPRHRKHVERVAFWVYVVDANGANAWGYPTLAAAQHAHEQNKLGHNYTTVGYTRRMVTQTDAVAELSVRFGRAEVHF